MSVTADQVSGLDCPPLFGTPRSPDRPTLGGRVGEVARRLGKPFMPHQQYMADVAMEIDPDTGLLAYDQIIIIGPRQNTGKTEFLLPLMTHRCVGFDRALTEWIARELGMRLPAPGPQQVLYTAQTADDARRKWRDTHVKRLEASTFYRRRQFTTRLQRNFEAIIWANGSMWSPASTTGKAAGTGDYTDLGVIDEAWSRPDGGTELGMLPTQQTRPWSQFVIASMIPGLSRVAADAWPYLRDKRAIGRARVEAGVRHGVALFDWAAPEGADPGDPEVWRACMPGLGRTASLAKIQAAFASAGSGISLVDFCAEYLGWEPKVNTPRWMVVSRETWTEKLLDYESRIAGRPGLCVEMSEDRQRGVICAAGRRSDGHWHVEVVEPGYKIPETVQGVDWMERRAAEMADQACGVAIGPGRPAASLIQPLRNRGITVLTPNQIEIAGACGRFYDRTGERGEHQAVEADRPDDDGIRLRHIGQPQLDRALARARPYDLGQGAFTFVRRGAGDIIELYGVLLAMYAAEVAEEAPLPEANIF